MKNSGWTRLTVSPLEPQCDFKVLQEEITALQVIPILNGSPDSCLSYVEKRLSGICTKSALLDFSRPPNGAHRLVDNREDVLVSHIGSHFVKKKFIGFIVTYDTISVPTDSLPSWSLDHVSSTRSDPVNTNRTLVNFAPVYNAQCVNIDVDQLLTVLGVPVDIFDTRAFSVSLKTGDPRLLLDDCKVKTIPSDFRHSKDILWVTWTAGPTGWYIRAVVNSMLSLSKTFRSFYESEFEKIEGIPLAQHHDYLAKKMRAPLKNPKPQ